MNTTRRVIIHTLSMGVLLMFSMAVSAFAQEHPEHPKKQGEAKADEHPKAAVTVTTEMMAEAIKGYIDKDTALKGGYFFVHDAKTNAPLALKLDKVHRDKLAKVSEKLYFACTDFKATNGKTYDLDFFMEATESGLQVSEVMIHKESGNPRYRWVEEGGVWKRK